MQPARSRWAGPMRIRVLVSLLVIASVVLVRPGAADAADEPWSWPVERTGLGDTFDPPDTEYGAGHRGLDITARSGAVVRAVAPGQITFVGRVGNVDVVTIDHGTSRSTYQPVTSSLTAGDAVARGEVIGILQSGPSHCPTSCLHLGRVAPDDTYLDPLDLLGGGRFRLISPNGPPPPPPAGQGSLQRPVKGAVTSAFGMRVHPITGIRKLHDGTDFGASCGTPVRAAAPGRVTGTPTDRAYGNRVLITHAGGLVTGYAHLSSRNVHRGQRVRTGTVVGRVGSTGLSTGCHLHFMVWRDGRLTDPMSLL